MGALEPSPDDVVLEIGAGLGTLTRRLARQVGRVIAIEKDRELVARLKREEGRGEGEGEGALPGNVLIVEGDALKLDWRDLASLPPSPFPIFKAIGNIPYYITAPLVEKALETPGLTQTVFLMQKEVADRLVAMPGSKAYGALSIGVQTVASVERLFVVVAGSFSPPPKVDSAVVRLTPLASPLVAESERSAFRKFLAGSFSQRRKQMSRSLRSVTGRPKEEIEEMLDQEGIDGALRIEALSPEDILRLFRATIR